MAEVRDEKLAQLAETALLQELLRKARPQRFRLGASGKPPTPRTGPGDVTRRLSLPEERRRVRTHASRSTRRI